MTKVLTTPAAQQAAKSMRSDIKNLEQAAKGLKQRGNTLSNQSNWEGPQARKFRADVWPQASKTLDTIMRELEQLRTTVEQINKDIVSAGS